MGRPQIHVVGAGLAGCEAAYFLAESGFSVILYEMRPSQKTQAHQTDQYAELVCSNSFKSKVRDSAPGMLKAEMSSLKSLILQCAGSASVPAGEALGVDRDVFSGAVTRAIRSHSNITVIEKEVDKPFADGITLFCTGPLTSERLSDWLKKRTGSDSFYFYDAIAPIVDASSIDFDHAFVANRYDKGDEAAYVNCPMNEEEYNAFIDALLAGEKVPSKNFEEEKFFQGCQPIEAIAQSGRQSLRYGPMKPVGLRHPTTQEQFHAVVQLRSENLSRSAYNIVGFQTKLKYGEQKRIFGMIPALKQAEFFRLGSIHRNTYLCAPEVLRSDLSLKGSPQVYFAGQITGVEGYLESAACGLLAAIFIKQRLNKEPHNAPPANTALGSLLRHVTGSDPKKYGPSNIHFGLFENSFFSSLEGLNKEQTRKSIALQTYEVFSSWSYKAKLQT